MLTPGPSSSSFDRPASRKPRPLVGVKGSYLKMSNFLSGKLRPLVGELHSIRVADRMPELCQREGAGARHAAGRCLQGLLFWAVPRMGVRI
jgi:hypothetical protein